MTPRAALVVGVAVLCAVISVCAAHNSPAIVDSRKPLALTEFSPGRFVPWQPRWCSVKTDTTRPLGTNALTGDVVYATSCSGFCFSRISPIMDFLRPQSQLRKVGGQYECGVKSSHTVLISSLYDQFPQKDPSTDRQSFVYKRKVIVIDQCACMPKPCVEKDAETGVETTHPSGSTWYNSCNDKCTCNAGVSTCCRRRKSFVHMSYTERLRYTSAVRDVAMGAITPALQTEYVNLIKDHEASFSMGVHATDEILSWHRVFILRLENILRQVDCRITVPYWAWELDSADLWGSSVWSAGPDGFGGGVNSVPTDGAFANPPFTLTTFAAQNFAVYGNYLLRRGRTGAAPASIFSVGTLLAYPATAFTSFVGLINSMHGSVHCAIHGTMCLGSSAEDPIFFLHHGNMDRLWAKWQDTSAAHATAYSSGVNTPMTPSSTTTQNGAGGSYTPADVLNIRDHLDTCVEYVEPGGFILIEDLIAVFPFEFWKTIPRVKPQTVALDQLDQWRKLHAGRNQSDNSEPEFDVAAFSMEGYPGIDYQSDPMQYEDPFTALIGADMKQLFTKINEEIENQAKDGETLFTQRLRTMLEQLNTQLINPAVSPAKEKSPCDSSQKTYQWDGN